jgi:hypothetical protein
MARVAAPAIDTAAIRRVVCMFMVGDPLLGGRSWWGLGTTIDPSADEPLTIR